MNHSLLVYLILIKNLYLGLTKNMTVSEGKEIMLPKLLNILTFS